jgi:hypothetical protein
MMDPIVFFWATVILISAVLFFGVALAVSIGGWSDLQDLFREPPDETLEEGTPPD